MINFIWNELRTIHRDRIFNKIESRIGSGGPDDVDFREAAEVERALGLPTLRRRSKKPEGFGELLAWFNDRPVDHGGDGGDDDVSGARHGVSRSRDFKRAVASSAGASSSESLAELAPHELCMVGDRLLTDIVFGNLNGTPRRPPLEHFGVRQTRRRRLTGHRPFFKWFSSCVVFVVRQAERQFLWGGDGGGCGGCGDGSLLFTLKYHSIYRCDEPLRRLFCSLRSPSSLPRFVSLLPYKNAQGCSPFMFYHSRTLATMPQLELPAVSRAACFCQPRDGPELSRLSSDFLRMKVARISPATQFRENFFLNESKSALHSENKPHPSL
jgi:hypothetical protein